MSRTPVRVELDYTGCDEGVVSDFSAVVYGRKVVWPDPKPGSSGPDVRYEGAHWFWEVEIRDSDDGMHVVELYEALSEYADKGGASFSVGIIRDETADIATHPGWRVPSIMSYRAGDRAYGAEQAALRGVMV